MSQKVKNKLLTDNQFLNLIIEDEESLKKYLDEIVILHEQSTEVYEELMLWLENHNPSSGITSDEAVRLNGILEKIDDLPKQKQAIKAKISMGISTH